MATKRKTHAEIFAKKTLLTGGPITASDSIETIYKDTSHNKSEDGTEYLDFPIIGKIYNDKIGPGSDLFTKRQHSLEKSIERCLARDDATIHQMGAGHYDGLTKEHKNELTLFSTNKDISINSKASYVSN